ncbi:hypothetical protein VPH35_088953 [Triticum aestivum]
MSGFLAVAGKIVTFLLWVLFLILQTATKVVGGLLQVAPPVEAREEPQPEAAPRPRSPPAARNSAGGGPADPYDPWSQPWDPPPSPHIAPLTDEYHSSSIYRRRVSAPQAAEDLVVSSSSYSRSAVAAVPASLAHAVSAPPVSRTIKTPAVASKRSKLERKYSKIVDQYRSLDEVIEALAQAGLESSNLIIGIDFTRSNDGQVTRSVNTEFGQLSTQEQMTVDAIVQASEFPLSIILVGVGDGPWDMMNEFDDNIPARSFDNFQFVNFTGIMSKKISQSNKETEFALSALMEIPLQYKATLQLGILGRRLAKSPEQVPLPPPFASYNTTSRAAPSWANNFQSVPSNLREEATLDSTITPSVTPPPAADARASELQFCPVCLAKPRDMAFGCGHQTCSGCGPQVADCPICRRPIDTRVKLY